MTTITREKRHKIKVSTYNTTAVTALLVQLEVRTGEIEEPQIHILFYIETDGEMKEEEKKNTSANLNCVCTKFYAHRQ